MKNIILYIFFIGCSISMSAQSKEVEDMWQQRIDTGFIDFKKPDYLQVNEVDVSRWFDSQPAFGLYKDNYIITGISTNREINRYTADAKFQISIRQRLTKTVLPFNSYLMLTYTQKAFWDIYENSAPFGDMNFNPGILLGKPLIFDNKLKGMAGFSFEHESNGKDTVNSRNWNCLVLSGSYYFNVYFSAQVKIWTGWAGDENKDIFKYRGYSLVALNFRDIRDRFWISAVINPRGNFRSCNTHLEFNYKISPKVNQYIFLQWYNGYGEGLYDFNKYTSMVRIGICIKPPLRNLY